jgi:hypothetical protein
MARGNNAAKLDLFHGFARFLVNNGWRAAATPRYLIDCYEFAQRAFDNHHESGKSI